MVDPAVEDKIVATTENRFEELPVEQKRKLNMDEEETQSGSGRRHLFGRRKLLHAALGSGKKYLDRLKSLFSAADFLLLRQKQMSGAILVSSIVIWLLCERIGYHLVPFLCHFLILALAILFLWSNLSSFVNKSPPNFPDIRLSQELCDCVALLLKDQINQGGRQLNTLVLCALCTNQIEEQVTHVVAIFLGTDKVNWAFAIVIHVVHLGC
ncbi:unnamed protein product [Lactuca virosa]|uniref:Reticulon-like protein n=1 Tax=Lactuca virosa TaxID=75947 RepID=A0AAU9NBR4_9ASTR|nr:unnamed protein product [Lactuca virosa]